MSGIQIPPVLAQYSPHHVNLLNTVIRTISQSYLIPELGQFQAILNRLIRSTASRLAGNYEPEGVLAEFEQSLKIIDSYCGMKVSEQRERLREVGGIQNILLPFFPPTTTPTITAPPTVYGNRKRDFDDRNGGEGSGGKRMKCELGLEGKRGLQ